MELTDDLRQVIDMVSSLAADAISECEKLAEENQTLKARLSTAENENYKLKQEVLSLITELGKNINDIAQSMQSFETTEDSNAAREKLYEDTKRLIEDQSTNIKIDIKSGISEKNSALDSSIKALKQQIIDIKFPDDIPQKVAEEIEKYIQAPAVNETPAADNGTSSVTEPDIENPAAPAEEADTSLPDISTIESNCNDSISQEPQQDIPDTSRSDFLESQPSCSLAENQNYGILPGEDDHPGTYYIRVDSHVQNQESTDKENEQ